MMRASSASSVIAALGLCIPCVAAAQSSSGPNTSVGAPPPAPLPTIDPPLTFSVGDTNWTGNFGAPQQTDINALLFGLRYAIGDLRLTASEPYMRIKSAGEIFTGVEGSPLVAAPAFSAVKTVRDGWGDVSLGASYLLPSNPWGVDLELLSRFKIATASRKSRLSTGGDDYALGGEASKVMGRFAPFVSVTYRSFGGSAALGLKDGAETQIGSTYIFPAGLVGGLSYDYAQRTSRLVQDSQEFVANLSGRVVRNVRLSGFISKGLSSGAADVSGGLSLSLGL
jgi:hypothetical protein